jgi:hypothetical protein
MDVDSDDEIDMVKANAIRDMFKEKLDDAKNQFTIENQELRDEILRLSTRMQQMAHLGQQQAELNQQILGGAQQPAPPVAFPSPPPKDTGEILKLAKPELYDGNPVKLREFLTSLQQYFMYFPRTLGTDHAKAQFAVTRLTGTARTWFQPIIDQYMTGKAETAVNEMFNNYEALEAQLKLMFAPVNEERKNREDIKNLKQWGSGAVHAAKFKALAALVPWDETYLREAFYDSLKDEVKDELCKILNPPTKLNEYIQLAVQIDALLYSRRQEKKGKGKTHNTPNQGKKRQEQNGNTSWGTHAGPMEIGNLEQGKNKEQKPRRDIRNDVCYNCGKKGHHAPQCRSPKKRNNGKKKEVGFMEEAKEVGTMEKPEVKRGHLAKNCPARIKKGTDTSHGTHAGPMTIKKTTEHDTLPWVKCFNNDCTTHQDAKEDNGWYPREIGVWEHGDEYLQDQDYDEYATDDDNNEEYEHLAQGTYLDNEDPDKRYDPAPTGRDEVIAIRAVKLAHAVGRELNPRGEFGDHPALSVSHKDHADLAWISCYNNACEDHAEEKAKNGAYPVRGQQAYPDPYWWNQIRGYRVCNWPDIGIVQLKLSGQRSCWEDASTSDCDDHHCEVHNEEKISQWHNQKDNQRAREKRRNAKNRAHKFIQTIIQCGMCLREALKEQVHIHLREMIFDGFHEDTWGDDPEWRQKIGIIRQRYVEYCEHSKEQRKRKPRLAVLDDEPWTATQICRDIHACGQCHPDINEEDVKEELKQMEREGFNFNTRKGTPQQQRRYHEIMKAYHGTPRACKVTHTIDDIPVRATRIIQETPTERATDRGENPRDLCGTEITTQGRTGKFILEVQLRGHRLNALVDSGAMDNFITMEAVNRCHLPWKQKEKPYPLLSVEGQPVSHNNGRVDRETDQLTFGISGHDTTATFDIIPIRSHDLILGLPWLQDENPDIDWEQGQLRWRNTVGSPIQGTLEEGSKLDEN